MEYQKIIFIQRIAQSAGAIEYTDCFSTERKHSPMSILYMTLNNLMVCF